MLQLPLKMRARSRMPLSPKRFSWTVFGSNPIPPVADLDPQAAAPLRQAHEDLAAVAVIAGVGQRFLDDAVDDVLQDRGQAVEGDPAAEMIFGPASKGGS